MSAISDYERQVINEGIDMYRTMLEDENWHQEDALRAALLHVVLRVEEDMY